LNRLWGIWHEPWPMSLHIKIVLYWPLYLFFFHKFHIFSCIVIFACTKVIHVNWLVWSILNNIHWLNGNEIGYSRKRQGVFCCSLLKKSWNVTNQLLFVSKYQ
jgi:hypothetical protein